MTDGEAGAIKYDDIGSTYTTYRCPDPRIATTIERALAGARSVVDVGAGTGSYEPRTAHVVAVEPSRLMIGQRPAPAAPVVQAVAEHLPFVSKAFDAGLAVLTVHHWTDPAAGLRDLARVSRRQVVLTWESSVFRRFWFGEEYLPEIANVEDGLATLEPVLEVLEVIDALPVSIPWDCTDGFGGAYWRRPHMYLDGDARQAISAFSLVDRRAVDRAVRALRRDLDDGTWKRRHGDLLQLETLDLGYRLVVAAGAR